MGGGVLASRFNKESGQALGMWMFFLYRYLIDMLQGLYHAVSLVGTLLLQIGEVGQKFDKRRGSSQPPPEEPKERRPTVPESWSSFGSHFYQWNILVRVFSVPLFSIYCKNWSFNFFLRVLF